ncbi:MAG: hypothetical protein ACOYYF_15400 [Chloroflexota bacterium]|nr:hypothetical protein [Chloroflexota bacterium]MBI5705250.1 hypothetical protein [Chloroflexota bacterium]
MPALKRKLIPTEVNYGLLLLTGLPRDLLPQPTHKVIIVDADGEKFEAKMHSSQMRIDGLTQLHRKHNTYRGQAVTLDIDPLQPGVVNVRFGGTFEGKPMLTNLTQETQSDIAISKDEVNASFDVILKKIENAIIALNHEGAKALENGKYKIARDLMEKGIKMTTYRDKVKEIWDEWVNIVP